MTTNRPDRMTVARHEAGHAAAARAVGSRVTSITMDSSCCPGGYVGWTGPRRGSTEQQVRDAVAFYAAGEIAGQTGRGGHDRREIRLDLAHLPRADRARVHREGVAQARAIVARHRSAIEREAVALERRTR